MYLWKTYWIAYKSVYLHISQIVPWWKLLWQFLSNSSATMGSKTFWNINDGPLKIRRNTPNCSWLTGEDSNSIKSCQRLKIFFLKLFSYFDQNWGPIYPFRKFSALSSIKFNLQVAARIYNLSKNTNYGSPRCVILWSIPSISSEALDFFYMKSREKKGTRKCFFSKDFIPLEVITEYMGPKSKHWSFYISTNIPPQLCINCA